MKNRVINVCLILAVATILAAFGFYVRVGATADRVVVLNTAGMTCGSCVEKISKALQSQRGVAATEVDIDGGWVMAGYDSKQVAPETLVQRVAGAGFRNQIQAVLTPEQFRNIAGHAIGQKGKDSGCGKGCCGK